MEKDEAKKILSIFPKWIQERYQSYELHEFQGIHSLFTPLIFLDTKEGSTFWDELDTIWYVSKFGKDQDGFKLLIDLFEVDFAQFVQ